MYGKRLHALEELVTTLVAEQQRLAAQLAYQKLNPTSVPQDVQPSVHDKGLSIPLPFSQDAIQPPTENLTPPQDTPLLPMTPDLTSSDSANTIDPELVSSSADGSQIMPLELPNASIGSILENAHAEQGSETTGPPVYTDEYGILATDGADGAKYDPRIAMERMNANDGRYVGLGGTVWMTDDCPGIRSRVQKGLLRDGHPTQESLLGQPAASEILLKPEQSPIDRGEHLPPCR